MSPRDLKRIEADRRFRRSLFFSLLWIGSILLSGYLIYKLSALLLPITVGAVLAYLFRPLKSKLQVSWLPHEARILMVFGLISFALFASFNKMRQMIPDERQKLELKVRLKYKLNEKYVETLNLNKPENRTNPITHLITNEVGPIMDHVNDLLSLTSDEQETFERYRKGYKGQAPISDKFYQYYVANLVRSPYVKQTRDPASGEAPLNTPKEGEIKESAKKGLLDALSIWILAPLIFIFMAFDNGQMRRYFIRLIPNRYFELSLTVLDTLDVAVGKYLRGTLIECALVGLTLAIGLILLGIPVSVSLAIGLVSGIANAIPFLGTVFGLTIALAYSLIAENIDPLIPGLVGDSLALYVVILVVIAHILDNVIFQPFVLGSAVNLHPLVVVTAIIGGSTLMGLWGMLIAIPSVVIIKTTIETLVYELKAYKII